MRIPMFFKIFFTISCIFLVVGLGIKMGWALYVNTLYDAHPFHDVKTGFDSYAEIIVGAIGGALTLTVQYYVINFFVKKYQTDKNLVTTSN